VETSPTCQNSLRWAPSRTGCGEEQFKVLQSAEQLDVQKNVLLNGFDSSTENQPFFKAINQKKEVAPLAVKNLFSSTQLKK
jgi:hypothetical protein